MLPDFGKIGGVGGHSVGCFPQSLRHEVPEFLGAHVIADVPISDRGEFFCIESVTIFEQQFNGPLRAGAAFSCLHLFFFISEEHVRFPFDGSLYS